MRASNPGPLVIYSRKSRLTGKGESIENQIELCRQHIGLHFGEAAAENALVYEDEGFSGGNVERPQFKRMMADAAAQGFRAIVVYRLDRISRNIGDFARLIETLDALGVDFISIRERFDTSSPMGRAMMYISSVFSQLERETIAERIRDNMHQLSKTGRWLGGTPPTGYASENVEHVTLEGKTKKSCRLRMVPGEIEVVRVIFDRFIAAGSLTKTEAYLLQNGYVTKNGKPFSRFAIKGILANPVYLIADGEAYDYLSQKGVDLCADRADFDGSRGVMAYNRTLQRPGKAHQSQPMESWIVAVGGHEGVIPGHSWVRAQAILEQNKSKSYRRPRSHVALLSGLLVCGRCGGFMRPKLSGRREKSGEPLYTYLCALKERSRSHCCAMPNCPGNSLDAAILEQLKSLGESRSRFVGQLERSRRLLAGGDAARDAEAGALAADIAANETAIAGLVAALGRAGDTAAEGYIIQQIDTLHSRGEGLRRRLEDRVGPSAQRALSEAEVEQTARALASFAATVDAMSLEQRRAALRALVREVVWDGTAAQVVLYGSGYAHPGPDGAAAPEGAAVRG